MPKWVVPDYNINSFIAALKAMSKPGLGIEMQSDMRKLFRVSLAFLFQPWFKVGSELHIEPFGLNGIKLQTTNAAQSVYFQIIYKV